MDPLRQRKTIHSARHVHVREQCVYRGGLHHPHRLGGIGCFDNRKSGLAQAVGGYPPQENVVFYDKITGGAGGKCSEGIHASCLL